MCVFVLFCFVWYHSQTDDAKPKAAKKAAAVAEEDKGGPFSFGADSLEEFFGLTKKPRLVRSSPFAFFVSSFG